MIKLCKRDILIQKESIPTAKAIKKFERYGMKDKVHLLKYRRSSAVNIYRIEGFEDYSMDIWRIQQEFLNILT